MFEATILLTLLGLILWFMLTKEQTSSRKRHYFIDLAAELKPSSKRTGKERHR